jgi:glutathione synthase
MSRIALLIQVTPQIEDGNYLRLSRSLSGLGHEIDLIFVDSLRMSVGVVTGVGFSCQSTLSAGEGFPVLSTMPLDHELAWILSIGERASFLDKIQLLNALPDSVQVINSTDAIMYLKSKYQLATRPDIFKSPETHASPNAEELAAVIRDRGGKWIIKPPAGSLGRDVFLTSESDNNLNAILQHLCGPQNNNYTMIQRYVPEIEQGEKRVLLAGGEVIGQYRRIATLDHRTNVSQGAAVEACDLTDDERQYCAFLAQKLVKRGAIYSGIDLAYPWLIEVNVVNPGGITTIEELTGEDHSMAVAEAITRRLL